MAHKPERLDKLLSRLGYGSRKEVAFWAKKGLIAIGDRPAKSASDKVLAEDVLLDGEPLDHPYGLTLIYHKPLGVTCSHKEGGRLIYDDLPEHWTLRKPPLSSVGRLDKETSGLLIITDNGQLNHHLTSPKHEISKTYRVLLAEPMKGDEAEHFASGTLMLEGEDTPCLPAELSVISPTEADLTIHEGRYHQVRRMFAATGNLVTELIRTHIGALALHNLELAPGEYRAIEPESLLQKIEATAD